MNSNFVVNSDFSECKEETCLFDSIPEYNQIILDLSRGNLKADFSLNNRKSKLSYALNDILFDEENNELSYFILFMDSKSSSNYIKFLLDLKNFEGALRKNKQNTIKSCKTCSIKSEINVLNNKDLCECLKNHNEMVAQDSLSIFSKYISKDAKYSINASDEIINEIISRICPEEGMKIDLDCFNPGKEYVFNYIQQNFYDKYLLSEYHCKYLSNILENRLLTLSDLLYDDIAVVYLLEYLEQESRSDLLKFWIQAENFSSNISMLCKNKCTDQKFKSDISKLFKQWQDDAIIIYDNFISLQAKHALGFDLLVRRQVESNICQSDLFNDKNDLEYLINSYSNCFYVPMLIVFNILDKVYFQKFLSSTLYKKYINEIKNNSNIRNESLNIKCSNKNFDKSNKKNKSETLSCDTFGNDPLWVRPLMTDAMQFGKIDSTGRFIGHYENKSFKNLNTYFDDLEDKDNAWNLNDLNDAENKTDSNKFEKLIKFKLSRLKKMLPINGNNLSSNKKTKEDFEMAERMAAMLVKDIVGENQHQS